MMIDPIEPSQPKWSDDALIAAFEAGTLPLPAFNHEMHVRVVWVYLSRLPPEVSLLRTCAGIRLLADQKFHTTITWAYFALISERRRDDETFEAFRQRCPELMDGSALRAAYPADQLATPQARRTFVLPRREASRTER